MKKQKYIELYLEGLDLNTLIDLLKIQRKTLPKNTKVELTHDCTMLLVYCTNCNKRKK